jgi:hypothetical protein
MTPPLHLAGFEGGHNGRMPPSKAGTWGTAAATYVPTNPHIRIETLIACFIGLFSPNRASFQL